MKFCLALKTALVLYQFVYEVHSHGYMVFPPGRSVVWKNDEFKQLNPHVNYNYMGLNCGGLSRQVSNNGKCGICGDAYNGPRQNEPGFYSKYAQGIITSCYTGGDTIDVTAHLTSNHLGWMEWRLCKHNDVNKNVTQGCLDKNLLKIVNAGSRNWFKDGDTRLKINSVGKKSSDFFRLSLAIPVGIKCEACVLQWIYKSGNNWGCDIVDGKKTCGIGFGENQEEFRNCADIAIKDECPINVLDLPINNPGSQHHTADEITTDSDKILHVSDIPDISDPAEQNNGINNNNDEQKRLLHALHQQIGSFVHQNHANHNQPTPGGAAVGRRHTHFLHQATRRIPDVNKFPGAVIVSQRHRTPVSQGRALAPPNQRASGVCKMESSAFTAKKLWKFCSDRKCRFDLANRQCVCL